MSSGYCNEGGGLDSVENTTLWRALVSQDNRFSLSRLRLFHCYLIGQRLLCCIYMYITDCSRRHVIDLRTILCIHAIFM